MKESLNSQRSLHKKSMQKEKPTKQLWWGETMKLEPALETKGRQPKVSRPKKTKCIYRQLLDKDRIPESEEHKTTCSEMWAKVLWITQLPQWRTEDKQLSPLAQYQGTRYWNKRQTPEILNRQSWTMIEKPTSFQEHHQLYWPKVLLCLSMTALGRSTEKKKSRHRMLGYNSTRLW